MTTGLLKAYSRARGRYQHSLALHRCDRDAKFAENQHPLAYHVDRNRGEHDHLPPLAAAGVMARIGPVARSSTPTARRPGSRFTNSGCHGIVRRLPRPFRNRFAMKVAVVKERRAFERRVAASPDTVKRMIGMGLEVVVESGAGDDAGFTDAIYGRRRRYDRRRRGGGADDADIVLKVQRPMLGGEAELDELHLMKRGAVLIGLLQPTQNSGRRRRLCQRRDHRLCDGAGAAHHPRAGDGRAVVAGQSRRLQGGDRCRRRIRPRLADDDDRGRHDQGGAGAGDGRGGRRAAGDRHRAAAWRHRLRHRCARRRQGTGREPRRELSSRSTRRPLGRPRPPAAMPARWARITSAASARRSPRR